MPLPVNLLIGFIVLSVLFGVVEYLWPSVRNADGSRLRLWRQEKGLDLCYWFFNPVVTKTVTTFCAATVIFLVVALSGQNFDTMRVEGFGPVSRQPFWLIVIEMLLLGDLIGYWTHRAFHSLPDLWDIHAVHHSSRQLDWFSSVRVHPLNDIMSKTIRVIPFAMLGFPLTAIAAYVPLLTLFAVLLHANVPWRFGPMRYVIASPVFHRFHHTSADEGKDKNFAGLFPIYDYLFGTLYLPAHQPKHFGVRERIPTSFFGQLLYPFRPDRPVKAGLPGTGADIVVTQG